MSAGHYHATMMLLFSLVLWLSLPPPPEPEPGTQPSATQQVTLWATEQKEAGRTLEALGSRTTTRPAVSPSDGGSDVTVATFLDRKLSQIDRQIVLINQLDDLLKQQRKAIIYEAVTGKIDLSNYEPPAPAMAA